MSEDEEFEGLRQCPKCGAFFAHLQCEDNDPIWHAICLLCDITWSWDKEGYWDFDRLCACGRPAVLNVSNGLYGCLEPSCPDYNSDHLDEEDYLISGYKERPCPP